MSIHSIDSLTIQKGLFVSISWLFSFFLFLFLHAVDSFGRHSFCLFLRSQIRLFLFDIVQSSLFFVCKTLVINVYTYDLLDYMVCDAWSNRKKAAQPNRAFEMRKMYANIFRAHFCLSNVENLFYFIFCFEWMKRGAGVQFETLHNEIEQIWITIVPVNVHTV